MIESITQYLEKKMECQDWLVNFENHNYDQTQITTLNSFLEIFNQIIKDLQYMSCTIYIYLRNLSAGVEIDIIASLLDEQKENRQAIIENSLSQLTDKYQQCKQFNWDINNQLDQLFQFALIFSYLLTSLLNYLYVKTSLPQSRQLFDFKPNHSLSYQTYKITNMDSYLSEIWPEDLDLPNLHKYAKRLRQISYGQIVYLVPIRRTSNSVFSNFIEWFKKN